MIKFEELKFGDMFYYIEDYEIKKVYFIQYNKLPEYAGGWFYINNYQNVIYASENSIFTTDLMFDEITALRRLILKMEKRIDIDKIGIEEINLLILKGENDFEITKGEIAKKLKLEYPYTKLNDKRESGRTTDMLLDALIRLKNGNAICLVGNRIEQAKELKNRLYDYYKDAGYNCLEINEKIEIFDMYEFQDKRKMLLAKYNCENIFIDHSCNEMFKVGCGIIK